MTSQNILLELFHNATVLLALGLLCDTIAGTKTGREEVQNKVVAGFIVGAMAIALMCIPVPWAPGIYFDTRTVILSLTGLFFGAVSTSVAAFCAALYRISTGGSGTMMGVATILAASLMGLVWRRYRFKRFREFSLLELLGFGLVVHLLLLGCTIFLPAAIAARTLSAIALPILLVYPLSTALLGKLLTRRQVRIHLAAQTQNNEERFNRLAEQSRTMTWEIDLQGLYTYLSPSCETLIGYSPEELVGKRHFYDLHPEPGREGYKNAAFTTIRSKGEFIDLPTPILAKDGRIVWVSTVGQPVLADDGTLLAYRGSDRDITRQKELEKELREQEVLHRTLFEQSPNGIVIIDPTTAQLLDFNDQAARQLGYCREEFQQLCIQDIDVVESSEDTAKTIRNVMESGFAEFETRHRTRQGEIREVLVKAQYSSVEGKPIYHCIWSDITRRKKEALILKARADLLNFSLSHPLDRLLVEALKKVESITDSPVAFAHLIQAEQESRSLTAWSPHAAELGLGAHEASREAELWIDCLRQGKPVVRNSAEETSAPVQLIRYLAVPIIRFGKAVGVIGVGNKSSDYTEEDVTIVNLFADLAWDITERKQVYQALRESHDRFAIAFENAPITMVISSFEDGRVVDVNRQMVEKTGYRREDVLGKTTAELNWTGSFGRNELEKLVLKEGRISGLEISIPTPKGEPLPCKVWVETIVIDGRKHLLSIALDMTEQRRIEEQLLQSQKVEALGQLAGGVAHDFNNILQVIIGYSSLLNSNASEYQQRHLNEIIKAAEHASALTAGLLAFSRKQIFKIESIALNELLQEIDAFLRRILREDIVLTLDVASPSLVSSLDRAHIQQVFVNLATNAQDAMPQGGQLTIRVDKVEIDNQFIAAYGYGITGQYARVTVSDTGCGIPAEHCQKIFEPFFTTKAAGKGTGLGLSMVYGIIKQHKGYVDVTSVLGEGTTFSLYLPLVARNQLPHKTDIQAVQPAAAEGVNILLAEDDPAVREVTRSILEQQGYMVIEAANGRQAVDLFRDRHDEITLVVLDALMPELNGGQALAAIREIKPEIRALFMSGYAREIISGKMVIPEDAFFISKPALPRQLIAAVDQVVKHQP